MTKKEKEQLNKLRLSGMKAKDIATELGIPYETIRVYISRHPQLEGQKFCKQCGSAIPLTPGRRRYSFCCSKCKTIWFNSSRGQRGPAKTCKHCGKEYRSYGNKSYCSRDCYLSGINQG